MKWLALAVILAGAPLAHAAHEPMQIKYMEPALFMTITNGTIAGKVVCLDNKTEVKGGLPQGWLVLTCSTVGAPIQWVVCYANVEQKSFICGEFKIAHKL